MSRDTPLDLPAASEDHSALYDVYLDACLDGTAPDVDAFLAKHGGADRALRTRLRQLHESMKQAASADALPVERLGGYRLIRKLGSGGMGAVYLAEHEELGRTAAIKVMRRELVDDAVFERRFQREARAVAMLQHPNIVRVYEMGVDQDLRYLAMERVTGRTLDQILRQRTPSHEDTIRWGIDIARALAYAHVHGVVHRDVKPSNVMIRPSGDAVLLDFGMVHLTDLDETRLTQTFAGSPGYAAPEQIQRGEIEERTDIYALGVTLFECVTQVLPFPGDDLAQVFRQVLTEPPPSLRTAAPGMPAGLDLVVQTCLEKRPEDRYPSAVALAEDLIAVRDAEPLTAKRPGWRRRIARFARHRPAAAAVLGTAVLALLSFGGWLAVDAVQQRNALRKQAQAQVAQASALVASLREDVPQRQAHELRLRILDGRMRNDFPSDEEDTEYDKLLDERDGRRARSAEVIARINALLLQAQRADVDVAGVDAVRARLAFEQRRVALSQGDTMLARHFDEQVRRHDPQGAVTGTLDRKARVRFRSEPPGAQVSLWRIVELRDIDPTGDRRWVPVPLHGADPFVKPGEILLRVARDTPGFPEGTLIRRVDGHPPHGALLAANDTGAVKRGDRLIRIDDDARIKLSEDVPLGDDTRRRFVFDRDGKDVVLPSARAPVELLQPRELLARHGGQVQVLRDAGWATESTGPLDCRPTATPIRRGPHAHVAISDSGVSTHDLPAGRYLVLWEAADRATVRSNFQVEPGDQHDEHVIMPPRAAVPPGFVCLTEQGQVFCAMEHEVTARQYMAFLRDPAIRAAIDAAGKPIYFPRAPNDDVKGGELKWERGKPLTIPPDYRLRWPVLGVNYQDALAYARWRSERDGRTYRLPTWDQWMEMCGADDGRQYVCGMTIRNKWVAACFSRPRAVPANVMSYPIDESPSGVFDTAASAAEWLSAWFDTNRGFRHVTGNSWGHIVSGINRIRSGNGKSPDQADYDTGFRLVFTPDE